MSFWGKLFGTDKALEGVIDGVSNGLDKLFYTDEEKAEDRAKDRAAARGMIIQWMQATQGQNLARRLLAILITFTWLIQYFAVMALNVAAVWVEEPERLQESARLIGDSASSMVGAVMLILGFYFAAPHMGDIAKAALVKFGKDNEKKEVK